MEGQEIFWPFIPTVVLSSLCPTRENTAEKIEKCHDTILLSRNFVCLGGSPQLIGYVPM